MQTIAYNPPRQSLTHEPLSPAMAALAKIGPSVLPEQFFALSVGLLESDREALRTFAIEADIPAHLSVKITKFAYALKNRDVDLPMELWSRIFSFLPRQDRVKAPFIGEQFAKYAWHTRLDRSLTPEQLSQVLARCGELVHHFEYSKKRLEGPLERVDFSLCPHLESITFFGDDTLTLERLTPLLQNMAKLHTVNVAGCKLIQEAPLKEAFPNLKVNFVQEQDTLKLHYLIRDGMRLRDFFKLQESRQKVLKLHEMICGLLRDGMNFEEFVQLGSDVRERFFDEARLFEHRFLIKRKFSLKKICTLPETLFKFIKDHSETMSVLIKNDLFQEFLALDGRDQMLMIEKLKKGRISAEKLFNDDLVSLLKSSYLPFATTFLQLSEVDWATLSKYSSNLECILKDGMSVSQFLKAGPKAQEELFIKYEDLKRPKVIVKPGELPPPYFPPQARSIPPANGRFILELLNDDELFQ